MILIVGGIKGGSGKTTLATNLSIIGAKKGRDILLIDADDQASATDFTRQRNATMGGNAGYTAIQLSGKEVAIQAKRMEEKYDDIIIDVGGRDTSSQRAALAIATITLIPFCPTSVDLWTMDKIVELLEEAKTFNPNLQIITFLNKTFPQGSDNRDAEHLLKERLEWMVLPISIGNRKSFSNAFGEGRSVMEFKPFDRKAVLEINALYSRIFNIKSV